MPGSLVRVRVRVRVRDRVRVRVSGARQPGQPHDHREVRVLAAERVRDEARGEGLRLLAVGLGLGSP